MKRLPTRADLFTPSPPTLHRKFPDGNYYLTYPDCPEIRFCIGMGGTCGTSLLETWHHPLCPVCLATRNLGAVGSRR